jgi:anti-anti-sigma factor
MKIFVFSFRTFFSKPPIMLKVRNQGEVYRISFFKTRRVNTLIADSLKEELSQYVSEPDREVILSMDGINFIDSSGFEAIMSVVDVAKLNHSKFRISDVSQEVYELLKLMKLKIFFEIDPARSEVFSGT